MDKWIIIAIVFIILGLILLAWFRKYLENSDSDQNLYNLNNDSTYREGVYRQVNTNFRPYIEKLYQDIDELLKKVKTFNSEINQAQYNSMVNILNKANDIEKQIEDYWNSSNFDKDFAYYIGLHYASHLLADAIKAEQQKIKDIFLSCKDRQDLWGKKIDSAKRKQERAFGEQQRKLSAEIREMCKVHKNISILKGSIGAINTQYNNRVTQQNIETGRRRDYIGMHFGSRGKKWRDRIMGKHPKC